MGNYCNYESDYDHVSIHTLDDLTHLLIDYREFFEKEKVLIDSGLRDRDNVNELYKVLLYFICRNFQKES